MTGSFRFLLPFLRWKTDRSPQSGTADRVTLSAFLRSVGPFSVAGGEGRPLALRPRSACIFGGDRQTRPRRYDAGKPVFGFGNRYGRKRGRKSGGGRVFYFAAKRYLYGPHAEADLKPIAMSPKSFRVSRESPLLPFLLEACRSCSRTTVKSYLSHGQVEVNGRIVTRFDHALSPGDEVAVFPGRRVEPLRHPMLRIVYEDEWLLVADKQSGLLSVGTRRERTRTAYYILSEHVKRSDPANRIFVVHRLDRATSGLLVFAKSERVQSLMQRTWSETVRRRTYVAVVEGAFDKESGTVSTYLAENKGYKVFVTKDRSAGERAVTRYRALRFRDGFSLVELELETGKKNQIRAHMEYIGHPVAGDR